MKFSELYLNRYLYRDSNQDSETKDASFVSADSSEQEPASIPSGGAAQDINTGNVQIDGGQLEPGTYPTTTLDVSNWGWGQTCVFSSTDLNTVSWGAGTFTSASGDTYSISAGNTGNMAAKTYIYLSLLDSETVYQKTTTSADSVGLGKVLIAVAENAATDATYNLQEAEQIVGDNILANTIDASKMNVGVLSAITANIGTVTAGSVTGITINGSTINVLAEDLNFYDGIIKRATVDTVSSSIFFRLLDDYGSGIGTFYFQGGLSSEGTVADSYSEANQSSESGLSGSYTSIGQSFTGTADDIFSCKFYLKKTSSPTGNIVAKLYAHTGVYGTNGVPTGPALATSETVNASTIGTSFALQAFNFSTSEQYTMVAGTKYCIVLEWTPTGGTIILGSDNSTPTHGGNLVEYNGSWTANSGVDVCFYVYKAVLSSSSLYSTTASNLGANAQPWANGYVNQLYLTASSTTNHPLNIPPGVNPTTPIEGDIWFESNKGLKFQDQVGEQNIAQSDGTTGGTGSAGAGNQYIELEIDGTKYKVLHDGTV